jgi:hypothetical protein
MDVCVCQQYVGRNRLLDLENRHLNIGDRPLRFVTFSNPDLQATLSALPSPSLLD